MKKKTNIPFFVLLLAVICSVFPVAAEEAHYN